MRRVECGARLTSPTPRALRVGYADAPMGANHGGGIAMTELPGPGSSSYPPLRSSSNQGRGLRRLYVQDGCSSKSGHAPGSAGGRYPRLAVHLRSLGGMAWLLVR